MPERFVRHGEDFKTELISRREALKRIASLTTLVAGGSVLLTQSNPQTIRHVNLPVGIVDKIEALNFSPIMDTQNPNYTPYIEYQQIESRLRLIAPYVKWGVMTYWCTGGLEYTGKIAHDLGLKLAAGIWLDDRKDRNENEIAELIKMGRQKEADLLVVGIETQHLNFFPIEGLISYIQRVKQEVPDVPLITADWPEVYKKHAELIEMPELDMVAINCYPFWKGISIDSAMQKVKDWYYDISIMANYYHKQVIISETGWPTGGGLYGQAYAHPYNAWRYATEFLLWAQENNIHYFMFEATDELWKTLSLEGPFGSQWGLLDNQGNIKPAYMPLFKSLARINSD